jgi:hypothetical protein
MCKSRISVVGGKEVTCLQCATHGRPPITDPLFNEDTTVSSFSGRPCSAFPIFTLKLTYQNQLGHGEVALGQLTDPTHEAVLDPLLSA